MTQLIKHTLPPHQTAETELIIATSPVKVGMHVTVAGIRGVVQHIKSIRGTNTPHYDVSTPEDGLLRDIPFDAFE